MCLGGMFIPVSARIRKDIPDIMAIINLRILPSGQFITEKISD
jgi:hypothetical protein